MGFFILPDIAWHCLNSVWQGNYRYQGCALPPVPHQHMNLNRLNQYTKFSLKIQEVFVYLKKITWCLKSQKKVYNRIKKRERIDPRLPEYGGNLKRKA